MDAIVQLIRNALCCVKDLNLFTSTILHDPNHTAKYYKFPSPHLNQTTPLELLISVTQLYACLSCSISGFKLLKNKGLLKLQNLTRIADAMKDKYKDIKSKKVATLIQESIMGEARSALRNTMVGICVMSIGVSFFWLFANSLHVTAVGWIGGLPALIHALTVMEVALVPLLYLMIKDAGRGISKAAHIEAFLTKFGDEKNQADKNDDSWLDLETFMLIQGDDWTPIWFSSDDSSLIEKGTEEKVLTKELEAVETKVKFLIEGNKKIVTDEMTERLQESAITHRWEGYREYIYFILNFVAFYGYLLGIIVYYFDKDDDQPSFVTSLKLGTTNEVADWTGNFAGDLMWTVEPAVILLSPLIIRQIAKQNKIKIKSD